MSERQWEGARRGNCVNKSFNLCTFIHFAGRELSNSWRIHTHTHTHPHARMYLCTKFIAMVIYSPVACDGYRICRVLIIHYFAVGATTVCMTYSILFLKLWSYIQVNSWCRNNRQSMSKPHLRRQSLSFQRKSKFAVSSLSRLLWVLQLREQ